MSKPARLSLRRVLIASGCLAMAGGLAVLLPLVWQYQQTMAEQVMSLPRPRPADAKTQAAIVRGLLQGHRYRGEPPPPPEPGDRPPDEIQWQYPLLVDRTGAIPYRPSYEVDGPPPTSAPGQASGNWLYSDDEFLRGIPRKLRQELVVANAGASVQPDPAIEGLRVVDESTAFASFSGAGLGWEGFHEKNPGATGILQTSRATLSEDGNEALIYAWNGCGSLCGEGGLFLLERDGERWKIRKVLIVANA
jgi:hypothetical protein